MKNVSRIFYPRVHHAPASVRAVALPCALVLLVALVRSASAGSPGSDEARHEVFFSYNATRWQESDAAGGDLLKEDGYMVSLHLRSGWRTSRRPDLRTELRGFTGTLDYDGMTFAGMPLHSTTKYFGVGGGADAGWTTDLGETGDIRFFAGLSADGWIRRIDNTGRINGEGYDEFWFTFDAVAGLTLSWERPAGYTWFLEPGIAYPLYQRVTYDLVFPNGQSDISVEPGREPGFSVEAGVRTTRWLVSLLYAAREFGRSDAGNAGPFSVYQPASEKQVLAIRFGVRL